MDIVRRKKGVRKREIAALCGMTEDVECSSNGRRGNPCKGLPLRGEEVDLGGRACITISSEIETFYPAGKQLKQEGKQLKNLQEVRETDQIH